MKRIYGFTAALLLASLTVAPLALGQSSPAAQAARLKRLQDQQAAVLARVKAAQAAGAATAAPTAAPTTTPTAVPTVTAAATAAKPTTSATAATSAKPATSASAAPATSASASAAPAPVALALDIEALRKTRVVRRHAEFTDLQARWGSLLSDPRATDELKLHAQRSAYLQRIRALGDKANDATFVKGVDALITREDTRDADALNALRSGALPAAPVAAAAPALAATAGASK